MELKDKTEWEPGHIINSEGEKVLTLNDTGIPRKTVFSPPYVPAKPVPKRSKANMNTVRIPEEQFSVEPTRQEVGFFAEDIRTRLGLYTRLHWVFRAVYEIASSLAKLPQAVTSPSATDHNRRDYVPRHPILRILRNPNPLHTKYELTFETIALLLLGGASYWFIERHETSNSPIKLHVGRPDRVKPEPNPDGTSNFNRDVTTAGGGTKRETWAHDDVVHFKLFNPLSNFIGLPYTTPGEDSAIIDLYMMSSDKQFWKNAINPRYFVTTKGDEMSDDAFERMVYELQSIHQGASEFHKVAVLENAELQELVNKHHVDNDTATHRNMIRDEILSTFGCHHLVALYGGASKSALEIAYRFFWELTVLPLRTNLQETITKELLWQIPFISDDPEIEAIDLDFEFNTTGERALRESDAVQSLVDFRDRQMGARSINEIRYDRGLGQPIEGGDDHTPLAQGQAFSRTRHDRNDMRNRDTERNLNQVDRV